MSSILPPIPLPSPRAVLVLAGATDVLTGPSTVLESARMPQLQALSIAGRVGRLRTVASHLPVSETTAAAALLGTVPPDALDPGAVAAESLGHLISAGEGCTVVEVVDLAGDPAPALDVERAIEALRSRLPLHRVVDARPGHHVLGAGAARPELPQVEGLDLRPAEHGYLPSRQLDERTVVVAAEGSTLLGVASLLGARTITVDPRRADRRDPVPARLRREAIAMMLAGAETVVVESRAPLDIRRGPRDPLLRQRALRRSLEALDRELIGPLRTSADWLGACLSVTSDLPRLEDGRPVRGDVPLMMTGPRNVFLPEPAPALAPLGTSLPPAYSERMVAGSAVVSSPTTMLPSHRESGPRRFSRDPVSGRTYGVEVAAA
ncbi:MAG: hypothetical protein Q7T55_06980 [Solirubrobacteraceae bacterium]|nr:hypothetical protein [Solirubrobacteraceae bacterium]